MNLLDHFESAIYSASQQINDSTEWRSRNQECGPSVMDELLAKLESITNEWCREQLLTAEKAIDYWSDLAHQEVTCVGCPLSGTCEFAWDLYNTNGDCLAEN